jgi:hypothetical protein
MTESVYSAKPEDGKELSRILESSTNNGLVDLIYTRRPDAYESYLKEPGEPRVFVLRKDGRIITTCAELVRDVYIGGKESKAAAEFPGDVHNLEPNRDSGHGSGNRAADVRNRTPSGPGSAVS